MSNAGSNLIIEAAGGPGPTIIDLPVKGSTHIYKGTLIAQNSSGYALPYSASGALVAIGVAQHEADNSSGADGAKRVEVEMHRMYSFANGTSSDAFADTDLIGIAVYATDDHTVAKTSSSQTRKPVGFFMGFDSDGKVRVLIDPRLATIVSALQGLTDTPASADALRDNIVASFG